MRSAEISKHGMSAGILEEIEAGKKYRFTYFEKYIGPSIALTMPGVQYKKVINKIVKSIF